MSGSEELRLFSTPYAGIREELLAFRNANRDEARDLAYQDWRYLGRPNNAMPIIVHAADAHGDMVGALALIPHHFSVDGSTALLGLLGDISVAQGWRRLGLARRMLEHLAVLRATRELAASLVLPNAPAEAVLGKAGWRTSARLQRHVVLLDGASTGQKGSRGAAISGALRQALAWTVLHRPLRTAPECRELTAGETEGFDERFDACWKEARARWPVLAFRDRRYLSWRYAEHPYIKYRIFTVNRDDRLWGYAVYSLEQGRCQVDDFLSRDGLPGMEQCLESFLAFARSAQLARDIVITAPSHLFCFRRLYRLGVIKRPSHHRCMVYSVDARFADGGRQAGGRWFLTAGDKDT